FIRQQNERIERGRIFPVGVPPRQQSSRRRQSSNVYADINEDTMEQYRYICEQNSPDHYDEISVTQYDRDIETVPLEEFTDDSRSLQSILESKGINELNSSDKIISRLIVTHSYSDLGHACKNDNTNEVNPRRRVEESNSSIELVKDFDEDEEIFGDLGQFQVDYIHAVAMEEFESLNQELDNQTIESSL
ncbi:hypothetical protein MAR_028119, partial [Mya arenaria]